MNVAAHVERGARAHPDRPALRFAGRTITYGQLDELAGRVAAVFADRGIRRGDRVALYLPNCPEFVASYLAAQKIGAIAVSLNAFWKREEARRALQDCDPAVLVTDAERAVHVDASLVASARTLRCDDLAALAASASRSLTALDLDEATPSAIVYSSGTTGRSKGCTLSHGNVVSNIRAKVEYLAIAPIDRLLLFVPLFHCFGQNAVLNAAFEAGATVLLESRFDVEATLVTTRREACTMFFGPPPAYVVLLDRTTPADFASVRYFFSAAAPMPVSIAVRWFERFGRVIHEGYGLTETSPFASYNHRTRYRYGSIGTPIDGVEMKVVAPDTGGDLPDDEVGEIVVRGPNVMLGYWRNPEDTAESIRDGWFRTGDLGRRDVDGYFYVVDRLKDIINVGGYKVSPSEVEHVLAASPVVASAAVFSVDDPVMGEQVAAAVVLRTGAQASESDLIEFCRERLAAYKAPSVLRFCTALPTAPTGKVLRRELRTRLAAERLT